MHRISCYSRPHFLFFFKIWDHYFFINTWKDYSRFRTWLDVPCFVCWNIYNFHSVNLKKKFRAKTWLWVLFIKEIPFQIALTCTLVSHLCSTKMSINYAPITSSSSLFLLLLLLLFYKFTDSDYLVLIDIFFMHKCVKCV